MAEVAQSNYLNFLVRPDGTVNMGIAKILIKQVEKLRLVKDEVAEAVAQIESLTCVQLSNGNDFEAQIMEMTQSHSAEMNATNEQIQNISSCAQQFEVDNRKLAAQLKQKDTIIADITGKLNEEIKKSYHASKDQALQMKLMAEEIRNLKENAAAYAAYLNEKERESSMLRQELEKTKAAYASDSARTKIIVDNFLKSLEELGPPPA